MADDNLEVTNPILGSLKIASANLNTIATVVTLIVAGVMSWVLFAHAGDAKESGKEVAKELKEANREVAAALNESNKEVSKVLYDLAQAIREQNCLAQFPTPQEKARNADLCKRISR